VVSPVHLSTLHAVSAVELSEGEHFLPLRLHCFDVVDLTLGDVVILYLVLCHNNILLDVIIIDYQKTTFSLLYE